MSAADPTDNPVESEADLRRRIDRSVSRALVDSEYAQLLLADPTLILEGRGCAPQHYLSLRSIEATAVRDFARQAYTQFWALRPEGHDLVQPELVDQEPLPLAS